MCFFTLCLCDQRVGSASGEIQLVCPNFIFIVLSLLVLSHYPISGYRWPSFWIGALMGMGAAALVFLLKWRDAYFPLQLASGVAAAFFCWCAVLQTALCGGRRRKDNAKRQKGRALFPVPGAVLLAVLLLLILISRYDNYCGAMLVLEVLLFYLTDFAASEYEWMLKALGLAVLAAFFVFQGLAFVFRPYDSLRYLGLYANTNMNALFYQMVYCVFLSVFCILEVKKTHPVLKWVSFGFACAMWSFVLLTMCRSAFLGMGAATLLGLGITVWRRGRGRLKRTFVYLFGTVLVSILAFPVVYATVRYLPPLFHHPIWFMEEYSEDKVHSWDPYDSEKYTDWRDVLEENFGRLFRDLSLSGGRREDEPKLLLASSGENLSGISVSGRQGFGFGLLLAEAQPGMEDGGERVPGQGYSVAARMTIYRYYLSQLNLRGHRDSENGIQIDDGYFAPHAHNVVLQYAFQYGLPAGILFLFYLAASGIRLLWVCIRERDGMDCLPGLLLFAAIVVFGMMEIIWRYGQISHVLLLLLPCFGWRYREGNCQDVAR